MLPELRSFFAERFVFRRILQVCFCVCGGGLFLLLSIEIVEGQQQEKTNTG